MPPLSHIWLIISLAWLPIALAGQNLDSLKAVERTQKGQARGQTLVEIAFLRYNEEDFLQAYYFLKKEGLHSLTAEVILGMTEMYLEDEVNWNAAENRIEEGIELCRKNNLMSELTSFLLYKSDLNFYRKKYAEAIENGALALETARKIQDSLLIAYSHLAIADGYSFFEGQQLNCKKNLLAAAAIGQGRLEPEVRYKIWNDLGAYYSNNHEPDSAIIFYNRAWNLGRQWLPEEELAIVISNLSFAYFEKDSLTYSMVLADSAHQINLRSKDSSGLAFDHYIFSNLFERKGDVQAALYHATNSLKLARHTKVDFDLLNAYERLSEAYLTANLIRPHSKYMRSYYSLKDSIAAKERAVFNKNIQDQLQQQQQQAKIDQLVLTEKWNKQLQWMLGGALVLLLIIARLIYSRLKHRGAAQQARLKQLQAERKTHRIELEAARMQKDAHIKALSEKERQLSARMTQAVRQKELLNDVESRLSSLGKSLSGSQKEMLNSVVRVLEKEGRVSEGWEDLILHFENSRPEFFKYLKSEEIKLTSNEERLSVYAFMRLDNKSVAQLMGISSESVNKARYRLRKKLSVPKDQKLEDFIREKMAN